MTTRGQEQKDREGFPQQEFHDWMLAQYEVDSGQVVIWMGAFAKRASEWGYEKARAHLLQELTERAAVEGEVSAGFLVDQICEAVQIEDGDTTAKSLITQYRARVAAKVRAENEALRERVRELEKVADEATRFG